MRKLFLAALLAISPVTFADTLEHVEEEVHMALETIQALKAEINELKATVAMQGEVQEASARGREPLPYLWLKKRRRLWVLN